MTDSVNRSLLESAGYIVGDDITEAEARQMLEAARPRTMVEEFCSTPEGKAEFEREYGALMLRIQSRHSEMTIERAVEIINERKHHGHSEWYMNGVDFVYGRDRYEYFESFEVIAIAEKYERTPK